MSQEMITKLNDLLQNSPLPDEDVLQWQELLPQMTEVELQQLQNLLNQKLQILSNSDQLLLRVAETIENADEILHKTIPLDRTIVDLPLANLVSIFSEDLVSLLQEDLDLETQLDQYFYQSLLLKENIVTQATEITRVLMQNKEVLIKNNQNVAIITVGEWLNRFLKSKEANQDKLLDRLSFVASDELAGKLSEIEKPLLLELLKVYDFLQDVVSQKEMAIGGMNFGELKTIEVMSNAELTRLQSMAEQYAPGSLERLAVEEEMKKYQISNIKNQN